jgi:type I restriction enzyme S subunit
VIEDLKPYSKYKESGSKWLGAVPVSWEVRNLRTLISPRSERDRADLPLLSVAREKGVFVRSLTDAGENHNVIPEDLSNYKVARAGNLVINKMKAWQGSMGIAPCDGIVSPAYFVFDFRIANHAFGQKLLRSKPYVAHFGQASDGVRVGQWDLSIDGMRQIPVLVPSEEEQLAIVRFLDHANRKIDGFIRAKRKLIGLLNEQKQAIIHRAVTRGLDPNAKLKPSGIPWIGEIPVHWEARQLRRVCRRVKTGGTPKGADERFYESGGFNWHTPSDFRDAIELGDASRQLSNLGVREVTTFPANTILMIGIGATIGKVSISRKACSCNQQINAIIANERLIHLDYLAFYLRTLRGFILNCGKFTTMPIINQDETKRLPVLIPPIAEQIEIAKHIEQASSPFATAIARTEREIALMQEYRTRLTADIVTGKLDVREAAAKLPEEKEEEIVDSEIPEDETETEEFAE